MLADVRCDDHYVVGQGDADGRRARRAMPQGEFLRPTRSLFVHGKD